MADPIPDDVTPLDAARPKRAAPTLDLSATEIPRADAAASESRAEAHATAGETPPRQPSRVLVPALSGAIAGALVTGAILLAQWPIGPAQDTLPSPPLNNAALDEVRARVARLETRPAPAAASPVDLSDTTKRLDSLDKALGALREESAGLRTQASQAVATANEAKSAPASAAPTDLGPVDKRLTQLEATMRSQADKAAEQSRRPGDAVLRRGVVAVQLDALVRQGEPYAAALAAAKTLVADAATLRPLDAFAASGVPNAAKLSAELLAIPQLAPASETATTGGLIERMRAGATKLVKIERTDAGPNNDAAMGRASAAARRYDIASAVRELSTLPPADRVAVQPWIDRVAASDAARAASRQFADQAVAAASKPAP